MRPYGVGDIVELVASGRARAHIAPGSRGFVTRLDSNGIIWVNWAHGTLLPMIPEVDLLIGIDGG
jgi:hypothetical protein